MCALAPKLAGKRCRLTYFGAISSPTHYRLVRIMAQSESPVIYNDSAIGCWNHDVITYQVAGISGEMALKVEILIEF